MFYKEVRRGDVAQLALVKLALHRRAIHKRNASPRLNAAFDGGDAGDLERAGKVAYGEVARCQVLLENLARAGSLFAQNEPAIKQVRQGCGAARRVKLVHASNGNIALSRHGDEVKAFPVKGPLYQGKIYVASL